MKSLRLLFCIIFSTTHLAIIVKSLKFEGFVGGQKATENDLSYQVAILHRDYHICGGGIVGDLFVTSAAHCVLDDRNNKIKSGSYSVLASAINIIYPGKSSVAIKVIEIILPKFYETIKPHLHPRYRPFGDISILKKAFLIDFICNKHNLLYGEVRQTFVKCLQKFRHYGELNLDPAAAFTQKEKLDVYVDLKRGLGLGKHPNLSKLFITDEPFVFTNEILIIAGHGDNIYKMAIDRKTKKAILISSSDGNLRFAKAKLISNYECSHFFGTSIYPSNICAVVVQKDNTIPQGACKGDSGSPLVYNGTVLVGILNSGSCSENKKPSIYARVSDFSSFIDNAIKGFITSEMRLAIWKPISSHRFLNNSNFGTWKFIHHK